MWGRAHAGVLDSLGSLLPLSLYPAVGSFGSWGLELLVSNHFAFRFILAAPASVLWPQGGINRVFGRGKSVGFKTRTGHRE